MKTTTTTTAISHSDTAPATTDERLKALLAKTGAREYAFELRYKGLVVSGESFTWYGEEVENPDTRDLRDYIMERLSGKGLFSARRSGWHKAKFTLTPGPSLTEARFFALHDREWNAEKAA